MNYVGVDTFYHCVVQFSEGQLHKLVYNFCSLMFFLQTAIFAAKTFHYGSLRFSFGQVFCSYFPGASVGLEFHSVLFSKFCELNK